MYTHDIDYVIRTLGVGATYRGYRYLSYGIELCLTDEEYLLAISFSPTRSGHYMSVQRPVNFSTSLSPI